jgi:hypothetical protein
MSDEQLDRRVERTLKRNAAAIKRARSRSQSLSRLAELSEPILDRAFRELRRGIR